MVFFLKFTKIVGCFFDIPKKITITNAFKKTLDEPICKQNKVWVYKGY